MDTHVTTPSGPLPWMTGFVVAQVMLPFVLCLMARHWRGRRPAGSSAILATVTVVTLAWLLQDATADPPVGMSCGFNPFLLLWLLLAPVSGLVIAATLFYRLQHSAWVRTPAERVLGGTVRMAVALSVVAVLLCAPFFVLIGGETAHSSVLPFLCHFGTVVFAFVLARGGCR